MKQQIAETLLKFLSRHAGKTVKTSEIQRLFAGTKKPTTRRRSLRSVNPDEPQILLAELELLGLVELSGRNIIIRSPFLLRAKISLNPKGLAFATVRGADPAARDLFILPSETKGALTGDEVFVRITGKKRDRFEAIVVSIAKRSRTLYRMKLLSTFKKNGIPGVILDTPGTISACITGERIPGDILKRLKPDTTAIVKLTGRRIVHLGSHYFEAQFVKFESDLESDRDFDRILMKYNIDPIYPANIRLPKQTEISNEEAAQEIRSKKRIDLRDLYTVTIDGDDSKDFDDAISLVTEKKKWKLYVHIADVSHYVKQNTDLDTEATRRATSVYLANRVVPMLPPVLSENLCSLVAGKNRFAFTAEMTVDPKSGKITDSTFYKSVILVDRRLTYNIAEKEIDEAINSKETTFLSQLWDLSQKQKAMRIKNGRIDLNLKEPKLSISTEGDVTAIDIRERLKSSMLIEECMLSANTCVAAFLRKKKAITLYRVHEEMDPTKVETLNNFFKIYNIPLELKNNRPDSIKKALAIVQKEPGVERIFNMILLRTFMQANYRRLPQGHWGLAFKDYCHFTSPIRRYPDLVIHRTLDAILSKKERPYKDDEMDELGIHTSEQERKAMEAERDITKLKILRHIQKKGEREFTGYITGFRPDRVFFELDDYPVEAIVTFNHLTNDSELILPDKFSAYIKKFSRPAFLGEKWKLVLDRIDAEEIRLYCKPHPQTPSSFFG